ncbi:MAG: tetratricopeptide repeat protein, partial [Candidatus Omnitrophica bacterium]|nr:tetratricopeptide repeat protein [Candidatus Omnitrophota bacterium]
LGRLFERQARYKEAEMALNKAMQIDPNNFEVYPPLAYCLMHNNKYTQAEEALKKALLLAPDELQAELTETLFICYEKQKKNTELDKMYRAFVCNYFKIKEMVTQKGIQLVCVQYPMRSIKPLRKIFASEEGIIFVDNEKVFKDALKNVKYSDYFVDSFGGDFGHCSPKGNRLLAENIVNVITREIFNK